MQLSVIIVNHNTRDLLRACLQSVGEHLGEIDYEVCVVDNASSDGSPDLVREQFPDFRVIANSRNVGFSAAVNAGLRATTGSYVMWLNSDAVILNGGITTLLSYMEREAGVGVVGPQIVNTDGSIQLSCRSFPSYDTALFNRHSLLTRWFPRNRYTRNYLHTDWDHMMLRGVDWVSGACLLHRREVAAQAGGLDERFFLYMEDIDFCLRASRAGWKVVYHPALRVRHHIGGSSRQVPFTRVVQLHRSVWRYYRKHFPGGALTDALAGAVIWGRCAMMLSLAAFAEGAAVLTRGGPLAASRAGGKESQRA